MNAGFCGFRSFPSRSAPYPTEIARGFRPFVDLLLTRAWERKNPPLRAAGNALITLYKTGFWGRIWTLANFSGGCSATIVSALRRGHQESQDRAEADSGRPALSISLNCGLSGALQSAKGSDHASLTGMVRAEGEKRVPRPSFTKPPTSARADATGLVVPKVTPRSSRDWKPREWVARCALCA